MQNDNSEVRPPSVELLHPLVHHRCWTHNHHWSQADIPKITCITVNTITTGPMSTSMKLYRTHHRKHTITTRPMSTYHTHTENTISIVSYASHKTQSPPELCPHIICIAEDTITTITMSTCLKLYASQKTHDHHRT